MENQESPKSMGPMPQNVQMMEAAKKALQQIDPITVKLRPYQNVIEALNFELQRTHNLVLAKLQTKNITLAEEEVLKDLRNAYSCAIEKYKVAHEELSK